MSVEGRTRVLHRVRRVLERGEDVRGCEARRERRGVSGGELEAGKGRRTKKGGVRGAEAHAPAKARRSRDDDRTGLNAAGAGAPREGRARVGACPTRPTTVREAKGRSTALSGPRAEILLFPSGRACCQPAHAGTNGEIRRDERSERARRERCPSTASPFIADNARGRARASARCRPSHRRSSAMDDAHARDVREVCRRPFPRPRLQRPHSPAAFKPRGFVLRSTPIDAVVCPPPREHPRAVALAPRRLPRFPPRQSSHHRPLLSTPPIPLRLPPSIRCARSSTSTPRSGSRIARWRSRVAVRPERDPRRSRHAVLEARPEAVRRSAGEDPHRRRDRVARHRFARRRGASARWSSPG